jgi:predicted ATPase
VLGAAPLIASLLETAPGLKVLATSRAPLRLRAEQEVPVAPLALPPSTTGPVSLAAAHDAPAVQLFLARAQAVKPGLTLDERTAPTIAAICRRLDGLPLAIELAAARIRILAPEQLLGRLDARLQLLTGGSRDLPIRQQTLRATIEWSHDLLDPAEQTLFARLVVFAGGCTFEAAEAVCGAAGELGIEVLDGLEALVEQSLLRQGDGGDGAPRFTMLETIREYGHERLAATSEEATTRDAHFGYYLTLAERAEAELDGPEQEAWIDLLELELDNLRVALGWGLNGEMAESEEPLRLSAALWGFWARRGYLSEGLSWIEAALEECPTVAGEVRAKALYHLGNLALDQGDLRRARTSYEAVLSLQREAGDPRSLPGPLTGLGLVMLDQGDPRRARELFEECLALDRRLGDRHGEATSLHNLGRAASAAGDHDLSQNLHAQALAIRQELGDSIGVAYSTWASAEAARRQGSTDPRPLLEQSLARFQEAHDPLAAAYALFSLAQVAEARGNIAEAAARHAEALRHRREAGDQLGIAQGLEALARVGAVLGKQERAAGLLGAAAAERQILGVALVADEQAAHDTAVNTVRSSLGDTRFGSAWMRGELLSVDQAVDEALALACEAP